MNCVIISVDRLDRKNIEETIVDSQQLSCKNCSQISITDFVNYLQLNPSDLKARQLFAIYDRVSIFSINKMETS